MSSWAEFYGERRLKYVLGEAERRNGVDADLRALVEGVVQQVVPRLLRAGHLRDAKSGGDVLPVVVHGDLWSGNFAVGKIVASGGAGNHDSEDGIAEGEVGEVVFDPSSCYTHAEFDHGIMNMFGGFGAGFWKEYFSNRPKDEPKEEYEDRVELYEL